MNQPFIEIAKLIGPVLREYAQTTTLPPPNVDLGEWRDDVAAMAFAFECYANDKQTTNNSDARAIDMGLNLFCTYYPHLRYSL